MQTLCSKQLQRYQDRITMASVLYTELSFIIAMMHDVLVFRRSATLFSLCSFQVQHKPNNSIYWGFFLFGSIDVDLSLYVLSIVPIWEIRWKVYPIFSSFFLSQLLLIKQIDFTGMYIFFKSGYHFASAFLLCFEHRNRYRHFLVLWFWIRFHNTSFGCWVCLFYLHYAQDLNMEWGDKHLHIHSYYAHAWIMWPRR